MTQDRVTLLWINNGRSKELGTSAKLEYGNL